MCFEYTSIESLASKYRNRYSLGEENMINFGTISTANITPRALMSPCVDEPKARVVSIAARSKSRAEEFAKWHGISRVYESYDEVIADDETNALYNPLPISMHKEWTIRALRAGKHVLCEKSFASNALEAKEMEAAGAETGLVLMDAFHYRYHPVFIRAKEIIESGEIGKVECIDAAFHVPVSDPHDIRMNYSLGGGVTMDIGCYPISWVRHLVGEEPSVNSAELEVGPPNVDTFLAAEFVFPSGVEARISGDMRSNAKFRMEFEVTGEEGRLYVRNPLIPQIGHKIEVTRKDTQRSETCDRRPTYSYQLDAFIDAIDKQSSLFTDAADAVKQMSVIDQCYDVAGLPQRGLEL